MLLVGTILPDTVAPLTDKLPLIFKPVSVPTLVILGCAAVVTVPAVVAAPLNAPVNVVAVTLPNVPLPVALTIPPVIILPAFKLPVAVIKPPVPMFPMLALAVTLKLANVPVLVIFGCKAVVNAPATVVKTAPVPPIFPTLALPVMLNVCPDMSLFPVLPPNTVWPPAGFVITMVVALALIVALPK